MLRITALCKRAPRKSENIVRVEFTGAAQPLCFDLIVRNPFISTYLILHMCSVENGFCPADSLGIVLSTIVSLFHIQAHTLMPELMVIHCFEGDILFIHVQRLFHYKVMWESLHWNFPIFSVCRLVSVELVSFTLSAKGGIQ